MFKRLFLAMLLGLALSFPMFAAEKLYGPIGSKDTLWNIAEELRPADKLTIQQVMIALYEKNQHAFTVNNINSLKKDAYLLAPTLEEVSAFSRKTAIQMVSRHNTRWKQGRYVRTDAKPPAEIQQILAAQNQAAPPAPDLPAKTDIAEATTPKTPPVQNTLPVPVPTLEGKTPNQQLALLKQELFKTQQENSLLKNELTILKQQKNSNLNQDIQVQLDALRYELAELRTILEQKDNHIKTLQASLKSASEAIKSQHADNMRLYNKLKELSPESVPAQQANTSTKPQLQLAAVESTLPATSQTPENVDNSSGAIQQVWADELQADNKSARTSIPLDQLLQSSAVERTSLNEQSSRSGISPIAWAAVLISFVVIIFLLVRNLLLQNEYRRYEMNEDPDFN